MRLNNTVTHVFNIVRLKGPFIEECLTFSSPVKAQKAFKDMLKAVNEHLDRDEIKEALEAEFYTDEFEDTSIQFFCNKVDA